MGYAFVTFACYACGHVMMANPVRVPSVKDASGTRQPVCGPCMDRINTKRKDLGLPPHKIHADAYEACDESEVR